MPMKLLREHLFKPLSGFNQAMGHYQNAMLDLRDNYQHANPVGAKLAEALHQNVLDELTNESQQLLRHIQLLKNELKNISLPDDIQEILDEIYKLEESDLQGLFYSGASLELGINLKELLNDAIVQQLKARNGIAANETVNPARKLYYKDNIIHLTGEFKGRASKLIQQIDQRQQQLQDPLTSNPTPPRQSSTNTVSSAHSSDVSGDPTNGSARTGLLTTASRSAANDTKHSASSTYDEPEGSISVSSTYDEPDEGNSLSSSYDEPDNDRPKHSR